MAGSRDPWVCAASDRALRRARRPDGQARKDVDGPMNRMVYRGGGRGEQIAGGPLGQARYALATGNLEKAESICRKRLERNPDDVSARTLLAQTLLQQHLVEDSFLEAKPATEIQPNNTDAQLVLSAALLQKSGPLGRIPPE